MFTTLPEKNSNFSVTFLLLSANPWNLDWSKILPFGEELTLFSIYTHFNTIEKKALGKHCGERWKCSNEQFQLFPQRFLCNLYLKIRKKPHSAIICHFFEFRMVSKWCIREWVESSFHRT